MNDEVHSAMTETRKKTGLTRGKQWLIALCLAVFIFIFSNDLLMPWYVSHGVQVTVPPVAGMTFEQASHHLDSLGFETHQADIRQSDEYPTGTVIIQNPLPGSKVKMGRRVYLTISGGEPLVTVPNLRGKTTRDAKFVLERNGLRLGEVMYVASEDFPANTIMDQTAISAGKVRKGTYISIVVSQKVAADQLKVPDVVGKPLTEAGRILANVGLHVGQVNYEVSATLLPNTVVDQYPRVGGLLVHGDAVDLFVVEGGTKKQLPLEN